MTRRTRRTTTERQPLLEEVQLASETRDLVRNILRVLAGAGEPHMLAHQTTAVADRIKATNAAYDREFPQTSISPHTVMHQSLIDLIPDNVDYGLRGIMVGALRMAANYGSPDGPYGQNLLDEIEAGIRSLSKRSHQ